MTRRRINLCIVALAVLAAGCPKKNTDDDDTTSSAKPAKTSAAAPTTTTTASAAIKVEDTTPPAQPGVEAHVKSELDGRADGITGSPAAAAGAKASLQSPTGWKAAPKGDVDTIASADDKARLGVTGFTGDATAKVAAAATALGLTNCTWNAPEAIVSGKDKLAATGADGVCTKGAAQEHAAYVAPTAEGLLVVGSWAAGGDMANVFGSMRSIAKSAVGTGDSSGIGACCSALRQNAKSAPPQQAGAYLLAAGACDAVKNSPQGRQALGTVRAALAGASMPASCK